MIACCGLTCTECPAYLATKNDDQELRTKTAAQWSEIFQTSITADDVFCDGCQSEGGKLFSHCHVCEIRACSHGKSFDNCALCPDYGCEKLSSLHQAAPEAKTTLDKIRA